MAYLVRFRADIPIVPTVSGTVTFDEVTILEPDALEDSLFEIPADYKPTPPWIYAAHHFPMTPGTKQQVQAPVHP